MRSKTTIGGLLRFLARPVVDALRAEGVLGWWEQRQERARLERERAQADAIRDEVYRDARDGLRCWEPAPVAAPEVDTFDRSVLAAWADTPVPVAAPVPLAVKPARVRKPRTVKPVPVPVPVPVATPRKPTRKPARRAGATAA